MKPVGWTLKSKLFGLVLPVGKRLLKDKLPRLTKRQLLLISAFAVISRIERPSTDLVSKLSTIFENTSGNCKDSVSKSMVEVAFLLKDYTWHELDDNGVSLEQTHVPLTGLMTSDVDMELIASYLADHTPAWLKYGSRELLVDDFYKILSFVPRSKLQEFKLAM